MRDYLASDQKLNFLVKCVSLGCLKKEDLYEISKMTSQYHHAADFLGDVLSQDYFAKEPDGFEIL